MSLNVLKKKRGLLVVTVCLLAAEPAGATWSIVAVDRESGEVGIAAASCYPHVDRVGGLAAGVGAVVAQAIINVDARDEALRLLRSGTSPSLALERIASETFDPQPLLSWSSGFQVRQYAVVSLSAADEAAAFTGERTFDWSGSLQAPGVSVQGNMLRGPRVLSQELIRFLESSDCTLADRLMLALEAGAAAGGDRRCTRERSALSAYLEVAAADDSRIRFVVSDEGEVSDVRTVLALLWPHDGSSQEDPVRALFQQYLSWRRLAGGQRECPLLPP